MEKCTTAHNANCLHYICQRKHLKVEINNRNQSGLKCTIAVHVKYEISFWCVRVLHWKFYGLNGNGIALIWGILFCLFPNYHIRTLLEYVLQILSFWRMIDEFVITAYGIRPKWIYIDWCGTSEHVQYKRPLNVARFWIFSFFVRCREYKKYKITVADPIQYNFFLPLQLRDLMYKCCHVTIILLAILLTFLVLN